MRMAGTAVIKKRKTKVNFAVAVIIVFDGVKKSIVIGISIFDDLFHAWSLRLRRGRFHAAVKLSVLIDKPRSPLSSGKVQLPIKDAHIEFAATGIIFVKFATVAERVGLRMPGYTRTLIRADHVLLGKVTSPPPLRGVKVDIPGTSEPVHRVIHLNTFPTAIVVVFVKNEIKAGPTC